MPLPSSILVTGAAGFIGSHLCHALLARGCKVVGLDAFTPFYDPETKRARFVALAAHPMFAGIEADVRDAHALEGAFARHRPRAVAHLAAMPGIRASLADPAACAEVNIGGTAQLLRVCARHRPDRLVFASSSSVYGAGVPAPFREDGPLGTPLSPYALAKREGETLCRAFHADTGVPAAVARMFSVYGPGQRPDLAVAKFMAQVRAGDPVTVHGDGSMRRDFTFVADAVAGLVLLLDRPLTQGFRTFNIGHDRPHSLLGVLTALEGVVGHPVARRHLEAPAGDMRETWADLSRSRAELGYAPRIGLAEGLALQWRV